MPKKEKLTREWKKFIQESTIKHNLLIEHGKKNMNAHIVENIHMENY